jgi:hypothetical protein
MTEKPIEAEASYDGLRPLPPFQICAKKGCLQRNEWPKSDLCRLHYSVLVEPPAEPEAVTKAREALEAVEKFQQEVQGLMRP